MAINIEKVLIELLLRIRRAKASTYFKGYFNKKLYYKVNNIYKINKTLIQNNINTVIINSI